MGCWGSQMSREAHWVTGENILLVLLKPVLPRRFAASTSLWLAVGAGRDDGVISLTLC